MKKKTKDLGGAFKGVSGAMLKEHLTKENKDRQLNFRVSESDFDEIKTAAESVGLSMSGYLLKIHKFASKRLRE